jgi:hypothetical protein
MQPILFAAMGHWYSRNGPNGPDVLAADASGDSTLVRQAP